MNRSVFALVAAMLISQPTIAQVPSIKESELFQTGDGWHEIVVENQSASSIVALHAPLECVQADGSRHLDENGSMDSLYQFSSERDIPPGGSFTVKVHGYSQCSGGVDAVIFSDGHSEGDSKQIDRIYDRRRGIYVGLEFAIPLLKGIASGEMNTQDVIALLERQSTSMSIDMSRSMADRSGEGWAYDLTLSTLRHQTSFRTRSDYTPNRQPLVDDLAKAKNISREQAVAIVVMNKLKEWHSELEGHTSPPHPE